ncbi:MAG: hypothetical protein J7515_00915 [Caulobacter sp.]|nr:hypothetical protein [Caulobacter sp.]
MLAVAGPALALQTATTALPVSPSPVAGGPKTYAECVRAYGDRSDAQTTCARLFPATAPAASTPSTGSPAPTQTTEPVDITPQLNKLIEAWKNRPKTTPKPPADPLAVIPGIQAACADYASIPERWRRCTLDGWRAAGFTGQPPLVLQNPPVVAPLPVVQSPPVQSPPVVHSTPPVQTPPPLTPETVAPEPVTPAPEAVPEPPAAAAVPPTPRPPPAAIPPPPPKPPTTPIWFWLAALVAAAGAGFGLAKLLGRGRTPLRPAKVVAAPCPEVALVADPGVVVLTPEGPPRAGMAVSLHFERASEDDAVRLDYPKLETAP